MVDGFHGNRLNHNMMYLTANGEVWARRLRLHAQIVSFYELFDGVPLKMFTKFKNVKCFLDYLSPDILLCQGNNIRDTGDTQTYVSYMPITN